MNIVPKSTIVSYTVELTEEQLVGLGLLSFKHESLGNNGDDESIFFGKLSPELQQKIRKRTEGMNLSSYTTNVGVNWDA